jgi:antitoxin component of MazEF toxin-antitoxin module
VKYYYITINLLGHRKMVKLQQTKRQFTVTIPKDYVDQAQLKKGDNLTISFNERGNLELAKVKP